MSNLNVGDKLRNTQFAINTQELKDNYAKEFEELDKAIEEAANRVPETTKAFRIKSMIDDRVKKSDYIRCLFKVLILDDSVRKSFEELLRRYNHSTDTVDTVPGCWCLNDDWYEFQEDAIIEYGGIFPINWNLGDLVYLEELYFSRKVYIDVHYKASDWCPVT